MKQPKLTSSKTAQSTIVAEPPKSSRFSISCKALCCCVFIIGAILNILLTTILLFGVENYHKADPVKLYEIFESPKYAETNQLLDKEQYLVLYGQPNSGIINFIEHQANLRAIQGKPVVMRDLEENVIKKHMKETKHFVEMYLGQVGRGHHSWFILLNNTEVPANEIEALKKKYPADSVVLIAHKKLNIEGFKNHKFPALKAKELQEFMEKDLDFDKKEVKEILASAATKDAPSVFQAYKQFEDAKVAAAEEAERLKCQKEAEALKAAEEAKAAEQVEQVSEKKVTKSKAGKSKKGKSAPVEQEPVEEQVKEEQQVKEEPKKKSKKETGKKGKKEVVEEEKTVEEPIVEQQTPNKKSDKKPKSKKATVQEPVVQQEDSKQPQVPVEEEQVKPQPTEEPKLEKKKSGKKGSKKLANVEEKVERQLEEKLEEVAQEIVPEVVPAVEEKKAKKGKKNAKKAEEVSEVQAVVQEAKEQPKVQEVQIKVEEVQVKVEEVKETGKKGKKGSKKESGKKGSKSSPVKSEPVATEENSVLPTDTEQPSQPQNVSEQQPVSSQ